jgi:glucosamine--fructose-6-phosphate aminotransferase (isomerizing)
MPELLESGLQSAEQSADYVAEQLARCQFALITGTAGNQGVAQEAALKIQECAAMPSQWDEAGSAYYGTVTILGPAWLLVSLVTRADYQLNRSLLKLAGRFGANRLCVAEPHLDLVDSTEHLLQVPESTERLLAPLLFLPPLYLLTYHLAVGRGLNPDEPVFSETMLRAMLPPGREEPDWGH